MEHIAPCGTSTTFAQEFSCGLELGELETSKGYFNGWDASVTGFTHRFFGFTVDFAGHYNALGSDSRYSFLFGPTFAVHTPVALVLSRMRCSKAAKESGAFESDSEFYQAGIHNRRRSGREFCAALRSARRAG